MIMSRKKITPTALRLAVHPVHAQHTSLCTPSLADTPRPGLYEKRIKKRNLTYIADTEVCHNFSYGLRGARVDSFARHV